jgi:hypothetical protein
MTDDDREALRLALCMKANKLQDRREFYQGLADEADALLQSTYQDIDNL